LVPYHNHHKPEDLDLNLHCCKNLKSHSGIQIHKHGNRTVTKNKNTRGKVENVADAALADRCGKERRDGPGTVEGQIRTINFTSHYTITTGYKITSSSSVEDYMITVSNHTLKLQTTLENKVLGFTAFHSHSSSVLVWNPYHRIFMQIHY
jgi:hypothetical protein